MRQVLSANLSSLPFSSLKAFLETPKQMVRGYHYGEDEHHLFEIRRPDPSESPPHDSDLALST